MSLRDVVAAAPLAGLLVGCKGDLPPPPAELLPIQYDVAVKGGGLDASFTQINGRRSYSGAGCLDAERVYVSDGDTFAMDFPLSPNGVRTSHTDGARGLMLLFQSGSVFGEAVVVDRTDDHLQLVVEGETFCAVDGACEPREDVYEVEMNGPVDPERHDGYAHELFVDPVTGEALCFFVPSE